MAKLSPNARKALPIEDDENGIVVTYIEPEFNLNPDGVWPVKLITLEELNYEYPSYVKMPKNAKKWGK